MARPFFWTFVLLSALVVAVALPLCIADLVKNNHERAYVGAWRASPGRRRNLSAHLACLAPNTACLAPLAARVSPPHRLTALTNPPSVWFVAGLFVLLAIPISAYGVQAHMEHYHVPRLQKHVVRILWMPCVYGLDAWLALRFKDHSIYFDTLRECYEAFVIYHFYTFLIVYLEQNGSVESILARKEQQQHLFPVSLFAKPWRMGPEFMRKCKAGVLNYVIIRPFTAAIALVSEALGVYGEGELFNATKTYTYVVFINSWAQSHAIYCLVLLFHATRTELEAIQPIAKFVCVKAVIFLSFWQSIAIVVMVHMHVLSSRTLNMRDYDIKDVANGVQEFIICVEMLIAACAHLLAFPVSEFGDAMPAAVGAGSSKLSSVLDVLDMSDVYLDVRDRAESVGGRTVGRLKDALHIGTRAKAKLEDEEQLGGGDAPGAMRLLPVGSERSEEEPGTLHFREDRDNLPFLAAASQGRRAGAGAGDAGEERGAVQSRRAGRRDDSLSPRHFLAPSAAAGSTVSIGGVQIALADLLMPAGGGGGGGVGSPRRTEL